MQNQHFASQNAPSDCLAAAGSLLLVGCCWLAAADWRATKSGASCNSHNDMYDIEADIL